MTDDDWGPAMRALTDKQRGYVLAMAADPFGNPTRWAKAAGYSDKSQAAKVTAHYLAHNPKVEAAVQEFARSSLHTLGPMLATAGMLRIARNPNHPKHMRALETIANRVGLHETTEQRMSVHHTDRTGVAMLERIKELAVVLGVDPARLLGVNVPGQVSRDTIELTALEDKSDANIPRRNSGVLDEDTGGDARGRDRDGGVA